MGKKSELIKAIAMINQIGIAMIIPILGCIFIGIFLDNKFDTSPWFLLTFIFIGIGVAFRNLFKMTKSFTKKKDKD